MALDPNLQKAIAILQRDREAVMAAFTDAFGGEPLRFRAVLKDHLAAQQRAQELIRLAQQENAK